MSSPPDNLLMLEVRNGDVCQFTTWMYRIARNARIDTMILTGWWSRSGCWEPR